MSCGLQVIFLTVGVVGNDSFVFAVRELPELARQYVIRILFVEQPVPQAVVASWDSQAFSKYVCGFSRSFSSNDLIFTGNIFTLVAF